MKIITVLFGGTNKNMPLHHTRQYNGISDLMKNKLLPSLRLKREFVIITRYKNLT